MAADSQLTDRLSTQASQNMMLVNALTVRLVTDLITEIIYDSRPNTDINPLKSVPMWALREGSVGRLPFFKDRISMEGSCIWTLNRWSQQIKELVLGSDP